MNSKFRERIAGIQIPEVRLQECGGRTPSGAGPGTESRKSEELARAQGCGEATEEVPRPGEQWPEPHCVLSHRTTGGWLDSGRKTDPPQG